jgi:cadmium resistance protein CadD (predicted permease)
VSTPVTLLTAVGAFIATNVDGLLLAVGIVAAATAAGRRIGRQLFAGQFLGFAVIVAISSVMAATLGQLHGKYLGFVGLVPIALGVRGLWAISQPAGGRRFEIVTTAAVTGITIAGGGDNVTVYALLFRRLGVGGSTVSTIVFFVLLAPWCALALRLGRARNTLRLLHRLGPALTPVVLIAIGLLTCISELAR